MTVPQPGISTATSAGIGGAAGLAVGQTIATPIPGAAAFGPIAQSTAAGGLAASAGSGTAAAAPATGMSAAAGTLLPGAIGGAVGMMGAKLLFPDSEFAESAMGIGGGALAGFMAMGPVGALVGGIVGGVMSVVDNVSVICTELNKQGHLPDEILIFDTIHGRCHIDEYSYIGYRAWGDTVVKWMQKSKIVTHIVKPFARAWAYEMASRVTPNIKGNLLGKVLYKFGLPICRYIGKRKMEGAVWAS